MLPGHLVYDESAGEAGLVTASTITPGKATATDLQELCEGLRAAAGLRREHGRGLPLEVIFTVPYKGMAIEGYYLPADGTTGDALVSETALSGLVRTRPAGLAPAVG